MQASQSNHDIHEDDNEHHKHRPVKHVRSHDINGQKQKQQDNHSFVRNNRSMSAGFRRSIRHLTSCALVRRKPGRTTNHNNDHGSSTTESSSTFEDNHQNSPKALLIPTENSLPSSASNRKSNRYAESLKQSINDDNSSVTILRKKIDTKNSVYIPSTTSNTLVDNSPLQVETTATDDISVPNSRKLSSKEISSSLVNLLGTASDSVSVNNTTQIPTHETRHISSTPASSIDRFGSFGSSTNVGTTGMFDSLSSQRTISPGNNYSTNSSPTSYTWCSESSASIPTNSATSLDECLPRLEIDDKPLMYRQQFEPIEHFNWYGISDSHGPVIISYKYSNDQDKQRYVVAIVRTRQRTSVELLLDIPSSLSSLDTLRRICDQCAISDIEYFDPVFCDGSHDLLIKYDESHVSNKHKFGIIYQRENQVTEEEIFSNETHSIAMDKFLNLIGDRVKLKDFQGFRGGLDNKSDHTGTESIYEQFNNHEIMFHVSTLLPHSKIERQQLERKRHIGNDIVAIVFQESEIPFNPECIASQFLHVYLVITPLDNEGNQFKVSVIHRDGVPSFGPFTNHSKSFHCDQIFKQWLLTKLINAEMASCRTTIFQKYQERTKMNLFENLYRTLHDNNRPFMDFVLNHSQYKHECELEQQREDTQIYSSTKTYDRHADNSLLGSVRRRFIAPKVRVQNSNATSPTTIIISTPSSNNGNDSKSKLRTMVSDLNRSASRESMPTNGNNNGKMASVFSLSRIQSPKMEKLNTNRPGLEHEISDSSLNSRSNSKFLSPTVSPSILSNDSNSNGDSYLLETAFNFNKLSTDDTDQDYLQSSSKDDLIKFVLALQQQHSTRLAEMDQIHSKAIKQLQTELLQQQNAVDGES